LSDTAVGDELTVVGQGQVTRGVAGQGRVDESRNLGHDALPHRKPVQLAKHRRDMIPSAGARYEPPGSSWAPGEGKGKGGPYSEGA